VTALLSWLLVLALQPPAGHLSASASARSIRPGEIVLLTITVPEETASVGVRAFDQEIAAFKVGKTTWRAIVGIDLNVTPGRHNVTIEARGANPPPAALTYPLRVAARAFRTRRLRVAENFVNPPQSDLARIEADTQALAALWNASAAEPLWRGAFERPVPGEANSAFGTRSFFNGQLRSRHNGGDFVAPEGQPIKAPGRGRVVMAADLYFSGNTVVIDHGAGLFSLLAHLSEMSVKRGDEVDAGEIVGKVGSTGRVTGPHLHWAVRANGGRVDPLSLLAVLGSPPTAASPASGPD
jgi:murein DD-endopeptidase MepM/ murein hydrolase activator NlpD